MTLWFLLKNEKFQPNFLNQLNQWLLLLQHTRLESVSLSNNNRRKTNNESKWSFSVALSMTINVFIHYIRISESIEMA